MEDKTDKQGTRRKVSLTGQGKAAKSLRKRLAFALANNANIKSDSATSTSASASEASDQETVQKELEGQEERKSSIPRKISQGKKSPQAMQILAALNENVKSSKTDGRSRKGSLPTNDGIIGHKDEPNVELQKQNGSAQNLAFMANINNDVSDKKIAERQSGHDELIPNMHEKITTDSEDILGSPNHVKHFSLEDVEREVLNLSRNMDNVLQEFPKVNMATDRIKMKVEELRKERISYYSREIF